MVGSGEDSNAGRRRHNGKIDGFKKAMPSHNNMTGGRAPKRGGSKQKQRQRQRQRAEAAIEHPADGNGVSINALKGQIRSLQRRLHDTKLAADVRQDVERQLLMQRRTLIITTVKRERHRTLSKYHRVRFFERKKAARMVEKTRKALERAESSQPRNEEDVAELEQRHHLAEVDLCYTTHCPLEDVYVSLFPYGYQPDTERTVTEARENKSPLWLFIEQSLADGSIEAVRAGRHPGLEAFNLGERTALKAARLDEVQSELGMLKEDVSKPKVEKILDDNNVEAEDEIDDDGGGFFEPV